MIHNTLYIYIYIRREGEKSRFEMKRIRSESPWRTTLLRGNRNQKTRRPRRKLISSNARTHRVSSRGRNRITRRYIITIRPATDNVYGNVGWTTQTKRYLRREHVHTNMYEYMYR